MASQNWKMVMVRCGFPVTASTCLDSGSSATSCRFSALARKRIDSAASLMLTPRSMVTL